MPSRHILFPALSVVLLLSTAFANKKDAEAAALIEHAKQLSDIRADGAPAFRLKLSFKTIKEDGSALEGTYTEVWVSKAQWRKEVVLGDFWRTEVVAGKKRWLRDSAEEVPAQLTDLLRLVDIHRLQPEWWPPRRIDELDLKGFSLRCIENKHTGSLCFDKTNGTIAAEILPHQVGTRTVEKQCVYSDYQMFSDRTIARSYACAEDKHLRLEAKVMQLIVDPAPDPALFAPLDGAKESVNCLGPIQHPTLVHQQDPAPHRIVDSTLVTLGGVVGVDGKPHNLKVISGSDPDLNGAALEAARQWTFKPATCEGEPIETEIAFEIDFHP